MRVRPSAVLTLALACLTLAVPAGAQAAPVAVSGTIAVVDNTVLASHTIKGFAWSRAVAHVTFAGDLTGPATERYTSLGLPDGTILQEGMGSFTGTFGGLEGTLHYVFEGDAATGGVITVTSANGDLHGAEGQISYAPSATPGVFDYTGSVGLGQ